MLPNNRNITQYNSGVCKYCKVYIQSKLGVHAKNCKKTNSIPLITKECMCCKRPFTIQETAKRITCSGECRNKLISEKRKKYLQDNPETHVWKRSEKFNSVPCNNVKQYLKNRNIEYSEEYNPIPGRAFSIDIAFPLTKIGIEINGNQHYNKDGSLKEYYQNRHDLIVAEGWKLIEAHYTMCFLDENIQKLFDFDIPIEPPIIKTKKPKIIVAKEKTVKREKIKKPPRVKKAKPKTLPKGQTTKLKTDEYWETKKDIIFKHDIDFEKFGWVKQVAILLGYKEQYINRWMRRHHPEFYNSDKCFKRSTPTKK